MTLAPLTLVFVWVLLLIHDAPSSWHVAPRAKAKALLSTNEQQRIAFLEEELERLRAEKGYR